MRELVDFIQVQQLNRPHIKLIGICFGHQLLGRIFGQQVTEMQRDVEFGLAEIQLSDRARQLYEMAVLNEGHYGTLDRDRSSPVGKLLVNTDHGDEVVGLPAGFVDIGGTDHCNSQGFFGPDSAQTPCDINVLTLQAHPEYNTACMLRSISIKEKDGRISHEQAQSLQHDQETKKCDGISVGVLLLRMIGW